MMRKTIFVLLFLAVMAFPAAGSEERPEPVVLQLKWFHQFQFAGYYAAVQQGFYREAGLAVEIREGNPRTDAVEEVLSGRAHYGVSNSEVLLRRMRGDPVVALAAIFQHSPLVFVAVEGSGIRHPQDMIGRRVGISKRTRDAELLAMLQNEGISLDEIQPPRGGRFNTAMYYDGSADAGSAYLTNELFYLEEKKIPYRVLSPLAYGIDFYGDCLITSEQETIDHPDRVRRFREASLRGWEYAMAHPEAMVDHIIERYRPEKSRNHLLFEAGKMEELILPRLVELGHMNPGRWHHIAATFINLKMAPARYDLDGFLYDPDPRPDLAPLRGFIATLIGILLAAGCGVFVLLRFNRRLRREVRERERAEKTLRFQAELMDQIQDIIVATDTAGRISYVNQAAIRSAGKPEAELIGKTVHIFDVVEIPNRASAVLEKTLADGCWRGRVINRLEDGTRRIFESRTWVVKSARGEATGIVGVSTDITERERMAEALRAARDAADAANRAKSRFLANMSHEIRTPMNAILGFSEILKGRTDDAKTRTYLSNIHSSGKALLALIDDILDLSKIEAGKMELSPEPLLIRELLAEIGEMFIQKTREKGVDLQVIVPEGFPEVLVLDECRLRQILTNLLANAVKFTPRGSIRLRAHDHRHETDPRSRRPDRLDLVFTIEDTGIGIPETERRRIFDPFRQHAPQTPAEESGTGLGLSITRSLVTLMHGEISLESRVGVGSTFRVLLHDVPISHPPAAEPPASLPEEAAADFAPATILLVDDAPTNRELLQGYMEDQNLTVMEAESGEQALRLLRIDSGASPAPCPDAILMDIRLPGIDGYETTKRIRKHPLFRRVPVIALTASAMKEEEERALTIFDGYIRKPVSRDQVLDILRDHLRRGPGDGDGTKSPAMAATPETGDDRLPEVASRIEAELMGRWRETLDLFFIDDVAAFARRAGEVGMETGNVELSEYAWHLLKSTEKLNIDEMHRLMVEFETVVHRITKGTLSGEPPGPVAPDAP